MFIGSEIKLKVAFEMSPINCLANLSLALPLMLYFGEQDISPTRQFTDTFFEDSSPTHMFYAELTYSRKFNCQL